MKNDPKAGWSRRAFLRGAGGVAVGLPFMASLGVGPFSKSARAEEGVFPKRLVIMFSPNGTVKDNWRPFGGETNFTLSPILEPLAPFREKLLVMEGISMLTAKYGPGDGHQTGMGQMLTAVELLEGDLFQGGGDSGTAGWAGGISVDQAIANVVGKDTKLKSLELGVQVHGATVWSRMSYLGPNQPIPPECDPAAVFGRVFGDMSISPADLLKRERRRKSVLDLVLGEYATLVPKLDRFDREKLDAHLQAIREVEKRLQTEVVGVSENCVVPGQPQVLPHMEPGNYEAVGRQQMDLLVSALQCDLTRVATLQFSHSVSGHVFTNLGLGQGHHDLSHEGDSNADAQQKLTTINRFYASQMAYLCQRLSEVKEGDETLLDHTAVLWVNELGKGNSHSRDEIPYVMVGGCGGYFKTGRYLRFLPQTPHNDLLVTLMQAMGLEQTTFGDRRFARGPLDILRG
ncbi:MAG: DUF1552 domain-containing protein [Deltaproteobacteria bacterium]|jgi:hypothetical protein|nr:DUF1552 domain-containing protein [Deltaproteobacteria bacterium]